MIVLNLWAGSCRTSGWSKPAGVFLADLAGQYATALLQPGRALADLANHFTVPTNGTPRTACAALGRVYHSGSATGVYMHGMGAGRRGRHSLPGRRSAGGGSRALRGWCVRAACCSGQQDHPSGEAMPWRCAYLRGARAPQPSGAGRRLPQVHH
jgi:hypothetical protein